MWFLAGALCVILTPSFKLASCFLLLVLCFICGIVRGCGLVVLFFVVIFVLLIVEFFSIVLFYITMVEDIFAGEDSLDRTLASTIARTILYNKSTPEFANILKKYLKDLTILIFNILTRKCVVALRTSIPNRYHKIYPLQILDKMRDAHWSQ
jgi:hypothetical protein